MAMAGVYRGESSSAHMNPVYRGDHDTMAKPGVYRERLMARRNRSIQGELSLDMDPVYKERRITLSVPGVYRGREARSHMYTGELAQASGSTCIHGVMEIRTSGVYTGRGRVRPVPITLLGRGDSTPQIKGKPSQQGCCSLALTWKSH